MATPKKIKHPLPHMDEATEEIKKIRLYMDTESWIQPTLIYFENKLSTPEMFEENIKKSNWPFDTKTVHKILDPTIIALITKEAIYDNRCGYGRFRVSLKNENIEASFLTI